MHLAGDRWWPGTVLLYGPRWILALPFITLLPLAAWRRPEMLLPLLACGAIVLGPYMGLVWHPSGPAAPRTQILRILTCNIGGPDFTPGELSKLVRELDVDVVTLQETPKNLALSLPAGWYESHSSSVSVCSRYPLKALPDVNGRHLPDVWPRASLHPCIVSAKGCDIYFGIVHFPTPRPGLTRMLDRRTGLNPDKADRLHELTAERLHLSGSAKQEVTMQKLPVIIAGDFNMNVESAIYKEHWGDFHNAFSETGRGYGWSAFPTLRGLPLPQRIDHILCGPDLAPLACFVGRDVGSDHLPVIADIRVRSGPWSDASSPAADPTLSPALATALRATSSSKK
jgi:endonuclease/exonuclease/phosphatase family metal-dependent hydrolase